MCIRLFAILCSLVAIFHLIFTQCLSSQFLNLCFISFNNIFSFLVYIYPNQAYSSAIALLPLTLMLYMFMLFHFIFRLITSSIMDWIFFCFFFFFCAFLNLSMAHRMYGKMLLLLLCCTCMCLCQFF